MTEVYDYTSVPGRRGTLDMSRGTKSKAVFGEKGSLPQDEPGSGKMEMADYFRVLKSCLDEQEKRFNNRFDEQEKRSDNRFEA